MLHDIDFLVQDVKDKLKISSGIRETLQLLTLAPRSWTIEKTAQEFGLTNYLVRRFWELRNTHGTLPNIQPSMRKPIQQDTVDNVVSFFYNDEISRIMPGKKDCKSVKEGGERIKKQKRLVLINLNQIFRYSRANIQPKLLAVAEDLSHAVMPWTKYSG